MGILDALMGLTRPYDEDDDFFDDEEEYVEEESYPQQPASSKNGNPFFDTDTPEYDTPDNGPAPTPAPAPAARPSFMSRRENSKFSRGNAANAATANKIVFMRPDRYEDTKTIYDHLRAKRIVLMSLDGINKEIARRILDFMAGAAYASGGKIARISNNTYIITPSSIDMMGSDMMEELESNGLFF